ncbi:armadillo-type protein [Mycena latifolia]|nr:armadillo-type protein [Mycena latifolia]
MVRRLVSDEFIATAILAANRCAAGVVSCLRDGTQEVVASTVWALYCICTFPEGRQAAMSANMAEYLAELLGSPVVEVKRQACYIAKELASDKSTAVAILAGELCAKLESLSRDGNFEYRLSVVQALYWICKLPEGRQTAVNANVAVCLPRLLGSLDVEVQKQTCWIVAELADDQATAIAVLAGEPCVRLVSLLRLLRDDNSDVVLSAADALYCIARWPVGAQAVVDAKALDRDIVAELLQVKPWCRDHRLRSRTIDILGQLACHLPATAAVRELVSLLRYGPIICF